jgi:AmiR/NasT family two-component response regulator
MARRLVTRDQAYDLLRRASQHSQRKLADIAAEVADIGILEFDPTWRG